MRGLRDRLASLLEYVGFRSSSYYHSRPSISHDPDDPLAYYLDQRKRAEYGGPCDSAGLPKFPIGQRTVYLPAHLIAWGLGHLELYRENREYDHLSRFKLAADWLQENQTDDGCWLSPVPMPRYRLLSPWRSGMAQGLGISILTRAARLFDDSRDRYLDAAVAALQPFHKDIREQGITTYHSEGPFYEEYPCDPSRHVLNGFVFALWGLYDLVRAANHHEARLLWNNGLATLKAWLPAFDIGYWSLYQLPRTPRNPATVPYHELHIKQMAVLSEITDDPVFAEYHQRWYNYTDSSINALRTLPAKLRWLVTRD